MWKYFTEQRGPYLTIPIPSLQPSVSSDSSFISSQFLKHHPTLSQSLPRPPQDLSISSLFPKNLFLFSSHSSSSSTTCNPWSAWLQHSSGLVPPVLPVLNNVLLLVLFSLPTSFTEKNVPLHIADDSKWCWCYVQKGVMSVWRNELRFGSKSKQPHRTPLAPWMLLL